MSSITLEDGSLVYRTPYDKRAVESLKDAIPWQDRRWNGARKAWIVDPKHAQTLVDLTKTWFGESVQAPAIQQVTGRVTTETLEVRYIGRCKERGEESTATGYRNGSWSVLFPEEALREWFNSPQQPHSKKQQSTENPTHYQILLINDSATQAEVKKAYYRLVKQWHPDVCHEDGASEMFQTIKRAYDALSQPASRSRYDVGLKMQAMSPKIMPTRASTWDTNLSRDDSDYGYRTPLRCGIIVAEGIWKVGDRFLVSKIMEWNDIVNTRGETLITSWRRGARTFTEDWR